MNVWVLFSSALIKLHREATGWFCWYGGFLYWEGRLWLLNAVLVVCWEGWFRLLRRASISRFLFATQVMIGAGVGYRILLCVIV